MSPQLLIAASLILLVAVLWLVRHWGLRLGLGAEMQRKAVHVALGLYSLSFPFTFGAAWPVVTLCGLAIAILLLCRLGKQRKDGLGRALHAVGRDSYGDILLAMSVALLFVLKRDQNVLYLLPMAIIALADAAAAIVGTQYGSRFFRVESGRKSIEGVVMFALVAWIVSAALLLHVSIVPRENVVLVAFAIALLGAMIEAESWRGLDNLLVPVGVYLFLLTHLAAPASAILAAAAVLVGLQLAAHWVGKQVGATPHTSRVTALLLFCIWMTAGSVNIVAPIATLLIHFWLERRAPARDPFPQLEMLLALIGIALAWYVLGEVAGYNASFVYNLSFGCLAAGLLGLGLRNRGLWLFGGSLAIWAVTSARVWTTKELNELDVQFVGAALACVIGAAIVASFAGPKLANDRYRKLGIAAFLIAAPLIPIAQP